jgi:hypothetical protein
MVRIAPAISVAAFPGAAPDIRKKLPQPTRAEVSKEEAGIKPASRTPSNWWRRQRPPNHWRSTTDVVPLIVNKYPCTRWTVLRGHHGHIVVANDAAPAYRIVACRPLASLGLISVFVRDTHQFPRLDIERNDHLLCHTVGPPFGLCQLSPLQFGCSDGNMISRYNLPLALPIHVSATTSIQRQGDPGKQQPLRLNQRVGGIGVLELELFVEQITHTNLYLAAPFRQSV